MHSRYLNKAQQRNTFLQQNFLLLLIPMFLVLFADSYMGYGFPVILRQAIGSTFGMGLVMAFSSVVGVYIDLFIPRVFGDRSWRKILLLGLIIGISFPIFSYLGGTYKLLAFLLAASAAWGIYYELILFASQDFVSNEEAPEVHERDWALFNIVWQITILIAPILAGVVVEQGITEFTLLGLFFYVIAVVIFLAIIWRKQKHQKSNVLEVILVPVYQVSRLSFYFTRLFSHFVSSFSTTALSATYWNLGALFGLLLENSHFPDWAIFTSYSSGLLIGSILKLRFQFKNKHKAIFYFLLCSGTLLIPVTFINDSLLICGCIFLSTICMAFALPLINSLFSLEAAKAGIEEMYVISIERLAVSAAYIVVPPLLGLTVDYLGFGSTFSIVGSLVAISALFSLSKLQKSTKDRT